MSIRDRRVRLDDEVEFNHEQRRGCDAEGARGERPASTPPEKSGQTVPSGRSPRNPSSCLRRRAQRSSAACHRWRSGDGRGPTAASAGSRSASTVGRRGGAQVEPRTERAWQRFAVSWRAAEPGPVVLVRRAYSQDGGSQPESGRRNAIHRVEVRGLNATPQIGVPRQEGAAGDEHRRPVQDAARAPAPRHSRPMSSAASCGIVTLVSRRGETHVEALGKQAAGGSEPMRRDTIFRIASMTKPVAAAAAMILVEECRLRLDEPDRWLPSGRPQGAEAARRAARRHRPREPADQPARPAHASDGLRFIMRRPTPTRSSGRWTRRESPEARARRR